MSETSGHLDESRTDAVLAEPKKQWRVRLVPTARRRWLSGTVTLAQLEGCWP